jgi:hypothetical protein
MWGVWRKYLSKPVIIGKYTKITTKTKTADVTMTFDVEGWGR